MIQFTTAFWELVLLGLVAFLLLLLLVKLQRIINLLEQSQTSFLKSTEATGTATGAICTDEEFAAIMGVLSKILPDRDYSIQLKLIK